MNLCQRCGAPTRDVLTPEGPHYGRRECVGEEQHWIKWLPHPSHAGPPTVNKEPFSPSSVITIGSAPQRFTAERIRTRMLSQCRVARCMRTAAVIGATIDATWFLAHKEAGLDELHWPSLDQLDPNAIPTNSPRPA